MLIGKRKQKIVIIVGVIIMAFIIYRIYQKNRILGVYVTGKGVKGICTISEILKTN